jgi:hypothetical protein
VSSNADTPRGARAITVSIPFAVRKRGGRKLIVQVDPPADERSSRPGPDPTLLKALARAFRWRKLLEDGTYLTSREIARVERINPSYVARVLRLTLLSPTIITEILDGHRTAIALVALTKPLPLDWNVQAGIIGRR